jgi:hypothetical protein
VLYIASEMALEGAEWLTSRPSHFTPGKNAATHRIRDLVSATAGLDVVQKTKVSCPYKDSSRGQSQTVAWSLYALSYSASEAHHDKFLPNFME